jgi:hypothetical protein
MLPPIEGAQAGQPCRSSIQEDNEQISSYQGADEIQSCTCCRMINRFGSEEDERKKSEGEQQKPRGGRGDPAIDEGWEKLAPPKRLFGNW